MSSDNIIAIDGPAGSGKSTIARLVAKRLSYTYVDTGAMYRALTLKALRKNIDLSDEAALAKLANETALDIVNDKDGSLKVLLDGEDVTHLIRTPQLTEKVFYVARTEPVRKRMVALQRKIGDRGNCVIEGRDITTVVFPNTKYKFYLDAGIQERANRRHKELLGEKGQTLQEEIREQGLTLKSVEEDIKARDYKDKTRPVGPLRRADDAFYLDTTEMSIEEVVAAVCSRIKV